MTEPKLRTVLVVGDWFIDEYWFISQHHSDISSHRGPIHYRVVSEPTYAVRDLCGAGLTARVLYELRKYNLTDTVIKNIHDNLTRRIDELQNQISQSDDAKEKETLEIRIKNLTDFKENPRWHDIRGQNHSKSLQEMRTEFLKKEDTSTTVHPCINSVEMTYSTSSNNKDFVLLGVGRWNCEDDEILPHFIHAHCQNPALSSGAQTVRASSSLKPKVCAQKSENIDVTLENLEPEGSQRATTRCVRAYQFKKGIFEQIHRIDWATPDRLKEEMREEQLAELENWLKEHVIPESEIFVFVDDHVTGIIDEKFVKKIQCTINEIKESEHLPTKHSIKWYVRTKDRRITSPYKNNWPDWLKEIDSVELLAVGPEIACRGYPMNKLLTDKGHLSEHSYNIIDTVRSPAGVIPKIKNVVLTSNNLEVVALIGESCFVVKSDFKDVNLEKVGWTTAFFASLAYEMVTGNCAEGDTSIEKAPKNAVKRAIGNAHDHSGVHVPNVLRPGMLDTSSNKDETSNTEPEVVDWGNKVKKDWDSARCEIGVIYENERDTSGNGSRKGSLQLWWAQTDLPGYVVWADKKRDSIRHI